jgi:putative tributyrin esterase
MLTIAADRLTGLDFEHDAAALGRPKKVRVQIPERPAPECGFPTWYLLHGFAGDRLSWPRALGPGLADHAILVFPESGRRWFLNDAAGHRYGDYILGDLIPAIDEAFATDPRDRTIGGFSMGGAAALFLALDHPAVFPRVFSYAGAFYASRREGDPYAGLRSRGCMMPTQREHERVWGPLGSGMRRRYDPDRVIARARAAERTPAIVIEAGTDDLPRVVEMNRQMHRTLGAAGIAHTYSERPGAHTCGDAKETLTRAGAIWHA